MELPEPAAREEQATGTGGTGGATGGTGGRGKEARAAQAPAARAPAARAGPAARAPAARAGRPAARAGRPAVRAGRVTTGGTGGATGGTGGATGGHGWSSWRDRRHGRRDGRYRVASPGQAAKAARPMPGRQKTAAVVVALPMHRVRGFSFFIVSQAAMVALSGNAKGFGGDFRFGQADGLTGADKICTDTAERSMPGNGKTSGRAFLSATKGPGGTAVNAADRIGNGPWYDRIGRVVAMTKADLLQARPKEADPAIINDLPNEDGLPNQFPAGSTTAHDNHATVTGSTATGVLHSAGLSATCQDWTSAAADGGQAAGRAKLSRAERARRTGSRRRRSPGASPAEPSSRRVARRPGTIPSVRAVATAPSTVWR